MSRHNPVGDNVQAHSLNHLVTSDPARLMLRCAAYGVHQQDIVKSLNWGSKAVCVDSSFTMVLMIAAPARGLSLLT